MFPSNVHHQILQVETLEGELIVGEATIVKLTDSLETSEARAFSLKREKEALEAKLLVLGTTLEGLKLEVQKKDSEISAILADQR